ASVHAYLREYARTRIPADVMRFGVRVVRVERNPNGSGWLLQTTAAGDASATTRLFDFVIVASGFFAEPSLPAGLEQRLHQAGDGLVKGVLHSSQYRGNFQVANRRVVVVGSSLSASEIAADAALTASQLVHIAPHGFWALPRIIVAQASDSCPAAPDFVPLDVAFYRAVERETIGEVKIRTPGNWAKMSAFFESVCGDRRQLCCGSVTADSPQWITISDLYHQLLAAGKIRLVFGRVASLSSDRLRLLNSSEPIELGPDDVVILCSGYRPRLDFLAPDVLAELLQANQGQDDRQLNDTFCPLLLHQCILHPNLPGLAFVGMYRGPFWSVIELQARRVAAVFSGSEPAPSQAEMAAGVASELLVRDQRPRPQFPHPDL
uniref:Flavin-containing monooxygenase n=1 Tax=Macrostomum lignano TaxID=282301 RepID=A0A1I8J6U0_9PLAT